MDWCKNEFFRKRATREQLSRMGKLSQRVQEIKRLNREPPLYHPIGKPFCGLIYSLNCQYEQELEQTILLFETNHRNSYRAIVNNHKMHDRGGWHDWHEYNAKAMQQRFLEL